jgi:hypothetical protein
LAQCVKESIEFLRPSLKSGNLGNGFLIDSIDPMNIDDIIIQRNSFYVNLNNIKAFGSSNFKIKKIRVSADPFKIDAIIEVPKVEAYGKYKLNMKLGILQLKGDGDVKAVIGMKFINFSLFLTFYDFVYFRRQRSSKSFCIGHKSSQKWSRISSN